MTKNELIMLQSLPLEVKIEKSKLRIREYVDQFGVDGVYVSFSGGKDSTVLLHLVRSMFPNVTALFSNTGLEFPEVVDFVRTFDNVDIVRPKRNFKEVIETEGYPIISKKTAMMIKRCRLPQGQQENTKRLYLEGIKADGTKASASSVLAEKWKYLLDADIKISDECCNILKKEPLKRYGKETNKVPIIGTMAAEGGIRQDGYLKTGCNAFNGSNSKCQPFGFWTEQDILKYIVTFNLEIPSVYGEIKMTDCGRYYLTGEQRTGCVFCGFGCHLDKGENRYQRLERTHPQLHSYCMDRLGFKDVLEAINVPYTNNNID